MPDEPIRERILQHCEASLALIDGAGAYHHALADVQRGQAVPDDLTVLPAAFLQEGDEDEPEQDTNLLLRWTLPITVEGWLRSAEGNLPTLANRLLADMERALTADPTRGGLATKTVVTGRGTTTDAAPGTMASARLQAVITYHTRRGDPANAG